MSVKYLLRNKDGELRCAVGRDMCRTLIRRYLGEWEDDQNGQSLYVFKERAAYGNADITICIFPGDYINVEDINVEDSYR